MEAFRESSAAAIGSMVAASAPRAGAAADSMIVEFKPFECDNAIEWHEWSKTHLAQARGLDCARELTAAEGAVLRVGAKEFDDTDQDAVRVRNGKRAWLYLLNACIGTELEIVQATDSPNEAWW